ncbi:DNA cytosine methyltransferase [Cysteiniphilum marinum]|nr:DNA cytosine methyltransferase [Cysteiniphilum marinum]
MKVLSLFDGISCAQVALNRAGIRYSLYHASEVDKYAIKVTQSNYPDTKQLGCITQVKGSDYDLIVGGSPCQGFSFAGKQLNFEDHRSKLFFEFVRVLKENNDCYFLFENVRMKKEYEAIISEHLGVEPITINSALVSAQNRIRKYWTNIPRVTQPEDKKICLHDVIEHGIVDKSKSYCIDANYFKGGNLKQYFAKHRRQLVFCGAIRGRYLVDGIRQDHKSRVAGMTEQRLELRADYKTNTLTTVQKDNVLCFPDDLQYRKLTPTECEALQTLPKGYTASISNTQRYKAIGNSFTVDVIAHIFSNLNKCT